MTADWMPLGNCVVAAMFAAVVVWIVARGIHALKRVSGSFATVFLVASTVATIESQNGSLQLNAWQLYGCEQVSGKKW